MNFLREYRRKKREKENEKTNLSISTRSTHTIAFHRERKTVKLPPHPTLSHTLPNKSGPSVQPFLLEISSKVSYLTLAIVSHLVPQKVLMEVSNKANMMLA